MFNAYQTNTLQYNPADCIGCGLCVDVCPHAVFRMNGRVAKLDHLQGCMECGACQVNCPTNAITVESGVGCASAMILAALRGKEETTCECG
jgi:NAD-dependent dihydropyrimidine dehydrogenase PreA subunit